MFTAKMWLKLKCVIVFKFFLQENQHLLRDKEKDAKPVLGLKTVDNKQQTIGLFQDKWIIDRQKVKEKNMLTKISQKTNNITTEIL